MNEEPGEIRDVESELEPITEESIEPGFPWGGVITAFGLVLVVLFAVQNTSSVEVRFLWVEGQFPLAMVILITALVSAVVTMVGGALYRRRRRRRRMEREQLRRLRNEP